MAHKYAWRAISHQGVNGNNIWIYIQIYINFVILLYFHWVHRCNRLCGDRIPGMCWIQLRGNAFSALHVFAICLKLGIQEIKIDVELSITSAIYITRLVSYLLTTWISILLLTHEYEHLHVESLLLSKYCLAGFPYHLYRTRHANRTNKISPSGHPWEDLVPNSVQKSAASGIWRMLAMSSKSTTSRNQRPVPSPHRTENPLNPELVGMGKLDHTCYYTWRGQRATIRQTSITWTCRIYRSDRHAI